MRVFLQFLILLLAVPAMAQEFNALARATKESGIVHQANGVTLHLGLSQAVPYRVFALANPYRLVLDFNDVDWSAVDPEQFVDGDRVLSAHAGAFRENWSRLVLELSGPLAVQSVSLDDATGASARLSVDLQQTDSETFLARSGAPKDALQTPKTPDVGPASKAPRDPDDPLVIVLDPGHGGIDPGAEVDNHIEAELMLKFARELKELLVRTGRFDVVLTRESNVFVPLETRVSIAHAANADLFMSLHADVVTQGQAQGLTIYTLSDDASDIASQKLAERHDRQDLLSGVDLTHQDDVVARVLMDMARTDTSHRADKLADALVLGLERRVELYKRPRQEASFSVLKAPDIPSVLVELGFMSSRQDLDNLLNAEWRLRVAIGMREALLKWAEADAVEADLRRK